LKKTPISSLCSLKFTKPSPRKESNSPLFNKLPNLQVEPTSPGERRSLKLPLMTTTKEATRAHPSELKAVGLSRSLPSTRRSQKT
jgi:hypothetical protein